MSNGLGLGVCVWGGKAHHLYNDSYKIQKKKKISDDKDLCVG